MEEFTEINGMSLNELSNTVLKSFGERYSDDVARVLNTGVLLPNDYHMIQLALAITMGMYMKKLVDKEFDDEVVLH